MVCSQVVNLLLKNTGPEIFADKLHDIKLIFETWRIFGKPVIRSDVCGNIHEKSAIITANLFVNIFCCCF